MRKALWRVLSAAAEPAGGALRTLWRVLPGVAGVGLLAYGAWLAWPPAGFMLAGFMLVVDRAWEQVRADRGAKT